MEIMNKLGYHPMTMVPQHPEVKSEEKKEIKKTSEPVEEVKGAKEFKEEIKGIAIAKEIKKESELFNWQKNVDSYEELELKPDLLRGIYAYGVEKPAPVQRKVLYPLLQRKTAIFIAAEIDADLAAAIAVLQHIDTGIDKTQCLITCPTREGAHNFEHFIKTVGEFIQPSTMVISGGATIQSQIQAIHSNPHIIVSTPGRALDFIKKGLLHMNGIKTIVLREIAETLSRGFRDQLMEIFVEVNDEVQLILYDGSSHTEITNFMKDLNRDYIDIAI